MKATGIVRRIDDLGRVVIPKELRRSLRIREGEPLEIFTDGEGGVVFRKHSPIGGVGEFTMQYADAINKSSGIPVAICDMNTVVAVAGISKKDYLEKPISADLSGIIEKRRSYTATTGSVVTVTDESGGVVSYLSPIVSEGSVLGAVMSLGNGDAADESEKKLINTGALFLSKQLEI